MSFEVRIQRSTLVRLYPNKARLVPRPPSHPPVKIWSSSNLCVIRRRWEREKTVAREAGMRSAMEGKASCLRMPLVRPGGALQMYPSSPGGLVAQV
jgi:hypothetical protein